MKKQFLHLFVSCLMGTTAVGGLSLIPQNVMAQSTAPSMTIENVSFTRAEGYIGETIEMKKFHIQVVNTTVPVILEITGYDKKQFMVTPATIPAGTSDTEITVTYKPTTVKAHKANLTIDCTELPEKYSMVKLEGIAIDKNNPPMATVTPNTLEQFKCETAQTTVQAIRIQTKNMAENTNIRFAQNKVFRLSTASVYKNLSQNVNVTFAPLTAGEYKDTIVVSSYGMMTQRIPISGIATPKTTVEKKEGVELKLKEDNPLKVLNEMFDNVERNKPINIEGWTNVAVTGTRAWWGYQYPSTDITPGEKVAKVTPYDSKVEYGDEKECEMLLVTPPLDFKNSDSKMLTIRLRGDYLMDNQTDEFKVYYMDLKDGEIFKGEMGGFKIPNTKDESGDWNEYHVNLEGLELNDVFFVGFGFKSMRGMSNSATYYIDDISYGRTDLPMILIPNNNIAFAAQQSINNVTEDITINAKNTTEPLQLKVSGPNASKFKLSTKTLPKEGGTIKVSFKSDKIGVHQAYIKVSSRGAADQYIALSANNMTAADIDEVNADKSLGKVAEIFDIKGRKVMTGYEVSLSDIRTRLQPGIYVVKTKDETKKITVK